MRHEWEGAALHHRRRTSPGPPAGTTHRGASPDRPAGTTYHLDGRFVTDIEGFHCAIGEAINGPGGYFGWNLAALGDCLRGRWGAEPPFRIVWHDSDVARRHLVPGFDRPPYDLRCWGAATTMEELLGTLADSRVEVELR
ncbi:barstar family protein [Nonomuraea gerenzanensis]|nr:barstar family protein [Nonomuraea gerenzanensis]